MSRTISYMGNGVALTKTVSGKLIYVDTDDVVVSPHVLMDGMWEKWITDFVCYWLGEGAHFVDVGAHIGWYTLLAAEAVGPTGRVDAFEPNPRLAGLLRRSLSVNGMRHVHVHRMALGRLEKTEDLFVPASKSGNATLRKPDGASTDLDDGVFAPSERIVVPVRRLDSTVLSADLIKIDAEGWEPQVIEGALELLRDPDPSRGRRALLVEHHDTDEEKRMIEQLTGELGYRVGWVDHDSELRRLPEGDEEPLGDSEMLFFER